MQFFSQFDSPKCLICGHSRPLFLNGGSTAPQGVFDEHWGTLGAKFLKGGRSGGQGRRLRVYTKDPVKAYLPLLFSSSKALRELNNG